MSDPKSDEVKLFSWTFILQALTLTFNLTYIVHLNTMISTGQGLNDIWNHWELFLITILSLATTLRKFEDLYENEEKGLKLITAITGMALVASIVADFHFLPALSGVVIAASEGLFLCLFSVFVVALLFFLFLTVVQGRLELLKGVLKEYKISLSLFLFPVIVFIIFIPALDTGVVSKALEDALLPMTLGALAANIIATILVISENVLYGKELKKSRINIENLGEKKKEIDEKIEKIEKKIKDIAKREKTEEDIDLKRTMEKYISQLKSELNVLLEKREGLIELTKVEHSLEGAKNTEKSIDHSIRRLGGEKNAPAEIKSAKHDIKRDILELEKKKVNIQKKYKLDLKFCKF